MNEIVSSLNRFLVTVYSLVGFDRLGLRGSTRLRFVDDFVRGAWCVLAKRAHSANKLTSTCSESAMRDTLRVEHSRLRFVLTGHKILVLGLFVLLSAGCRDGSPLNSAYKSFFETPEVLPTATPRVVVVVDPQIVIEPAAAYVGSYVNVSGAQWPPGEIVVIVLEDDDGRSGVLAASTVDSAGDFSTGFLFPVNQRWLQAGGRMVVVHTPNDALQATAALNVTPPDEVAALQALPDLTVSVAPSATVAVTTTDRVTATPTISATGSVTDVSVTDVSATERPTSTVESLTERQDVEQILFSAEPASPVSLDGNLDLWPDEWIPIQSVVWGADQLSGEFDLSADFQLLWSPDGLYVAVRVRDDQYRSGPPGTNLWQGDSFEIQFDRLLAADFTDPVANEDDYQLGIGFGPGLNEIQAYRWLPATQEGTVSLPGAVVTTTGGYQAEFLLPWILLDIGPQDVFVDAVFGFNLSINDNDSDVFVQQTTISASPNRTDHKTPTEWGTLRLSAQ